MVQVTSVKDGNIFEVMHLKKPALSEEQCAVFSQTISEAVLDNSKVKITLYNRYGNTDLIGIPVLQNGGLRLAMDESVVTIPIDQIISIVSADGNQKDSSP